MILIQLYLFTGIYFEKLLFKKSQFINCQNTTESGYGLSYNEKQEINSLLSIIQVLGYMSHRCTNGTSSLERSSTLPDVVFEASGTTCIYANRRKLPNINENENYY